MEKSLIPIEEDRTTTFLNENAATNLEEILSNKSLIMSGQVKLIGLDKLKEKLGEKWPALRDEIHDHLTSIIQKHIGRKDVFLNKSDEEFIIVFATTEDKTAQLISAKILQELTEKFAGLSETKDIIVKTAIQEFDGGVLFLENDLQSLLENFKADAENNKQQNIANATANDKNSYIYVYRPVWDVRNRAITTYSVNVVSGFGKNTQGKITPKKIGYKMLKSPVSKKKIIDLDLSILKSSLSTLEELHRKEVRAIFNIPLCYDSIFTTELLMQYVALCKNIPTALKKYIDFTLTNIPKGIPISKFEFIISTLKKQCTAIVLMSDNIDLHLKRYSYCDLNIIGIDLLDHSRNSEKAWKKITPFIEECHRNKFQVALFNVDSIENFKLANENKADYISGQAIGDYKETSGHMIRISRKELLAKL